MYLYISTFFISNVFSNKNVIHITRTSFGVVSVSYHADATKPNLIQVCFKKMKFTYRALPPKRLNFTMKVLMNRAR